MGNFNLSKGNQSTRNLYHVDYSTSFSTFHNVGQGNVNQLLIFVVKL